MMPFPRRKPLNAVLFLSTFSQESTTLEITLKLGEILRVASAFRVTNLYWVNDYPEVRDVVNDVSSYALTPPYLKRLIPLKRNLKYVGLLPPINVQTHAVLKDPVEGEVRVVKKGETGLKVKLGAKYGHYLVVDSVQPKLSKYQGVYYSGPKVKIVTTIDEVYDGSLVVVGDRYGRDFWALKDEIRQKYEESGLTVIIGPPQGLKTEVRGLGVNFIRNQGVKDVRTEEALTSALALINAVI
ncbi:MAG: putative RNA uridine N3 methyltransferase [Thermoprotei archaeon]